VDVRTEGCFDGLEVRPMTVSGDTPAQKKARTRGGKPRNRAGARAAVEAAIMSVSNAAPKQLDPEQVERLITALEQLSKRFDEFCGIYLNAKFPYGKPIDRWRRSA
jgi:hypothetical protein